MNFKDGGDLNEPRLKRTIFKQNEAVTLFPASLSSSKDYSLIRNVSPGA